jgi:hypothetical protein
MNPLAYGVLHTLSLALALALIALIALAAEEFLTKLDEVILRMFAQ